MIKQRLAILALATLVGCSQTPRGIPIRVIVPRGSSFAVATDSLKHAGLVESPFLFRMYARFRKEDRHIKPGTYLLKRGTPWADIIEALNGGKGLVNTITIPEGFGLFQIVPLLSERLQVPVDSVNAVVRDSVLRSRVGASAETLEGYVFPDTYAFPVGTTAREAITEMVKGFERQWKPEWTARLDSVGLDRNKAMTLASIVEREARRAEERPVIAAVYLNRLKVGMLLQADPTVQFALGRHTPRVLLKDLEKDSPYNTYKYPGLPPGPIASPGSASIIAALNPAKVDYLYFVAAPDGHHEFRRTLTEHDQAKKAVRSIR